MPPRATSSPGRSSTSARLPASATPPARPATPRASSTRIVPRCWWRCCSRGFVGMGARNGSAETLMPMAPMFHGNAWQFPYLAPMTGSRLILPGRNYEPEMLYELLEGERVTVTCGVPTMWIILTDWLARTGKKFSTLRLTLSSGSAPPRALVEKLERDWGVELAQAWGMTEALGGSHATMRPGSADLPFEQRIDRRMKSGRANYGTRYRIVDDNGRELPQDGKAFGHLRIKAPVGIQRLLQGRGRQRAGRGGLAQDRRRRHHRQARAHRAHRPLQGRHQVGRRVDQLDRARGRGLRASRRAAGGRDRRGASQVAGAAAAGRRAQSRAARSTARRSRSTCAARSRAGGCPTTSCSSSRCR